MPISTKDPALPVRENLEGERETVPYQHVSDLPKEVRTKLKSRKKRRQWMHVFNSAYAKAKTDGKSHKEAESRAFASAWAATKGGTKKLLEALNVGEEFPFVSKAGIVEMVESDPDLQDSEFSVFLEEVAKSEDSAEINIRFTCPITKVDKEKRRVRGIATAEVLDKTGEVLTYEGSKEAFDEWPGNIREMHQNIAAGKAVEITFDDDRKEISVDSYISRGAPDTWEKVLDGTLEFYSVGGKRVRSTKKSAKDVPEHVFRLLKDGEKRPKKVVWTPAWKMVELSLVDNPALPIAQFELVKSVGGVSIATGILARDETSMPKEEKKVEVAPTADKAKAEEATVKAAEKAAKADEKEAIDAKKAEEATDVGKSDKTPAEKSEGEGTDAEKVAEAAKAGKVEPVKKAEAGEAEKEEATPAKKELPDSSFAHVDGGVRHYPVKDAEGNCDAARVRSALAHASTQIKGEGEAAEIAKKAMPKIRATAKRLQAGQFKENPAEFLNFYDVFKVGFSYEDELESTTPLAREDVLAFVAKAAEAEKSEETVWMSTHPIYSFDARPVTFGEAMARYEQLEVEEKFFDQLDILKRVLANTLLAWNLSVDERKEMVEKSFDEFSEAAFELVEELEPEKVAKVEPEKSEQTDSAVSPDVIGNITSLIEGLQKTISEQIAPEKLREAVGQPEIVETMKAAQEQLEDTAKRLEKLEGQPVVPEALKLKVAHKNGTAEELSGDENNDKAIKMDGKIYTLAELAKEFEETRKQAAQQMGAQEREKLEVRLLKLERHMKVLRGEKVYSPPPR